MRTVVATCILIAGTLGGPHALAQVNEKFADLEDEIAMVRSMAQTERKTAVANNMSMTAEEKKAFWPLYTQYRADMNKANDKLVKVVTDYGAHHETLTDAQGKQLMEDYLNYQQEVLKTRRAYLGKFSNILAGAKVARFYQIENKLDTLAALSMASEIPLAKAAVKQ